MDTHRIYKDSVVKNGRALLANSQPSDLDECRIGEQDFNRAIEDLNDAWEQLESAISDRQTQLLLSNVAQQVCPTQSVCFACCSTNTELLIFHQTENFINIQLLIYQRILILTSRFLTFFVYSLNVKRISSTLH